MIFQRYQASNRSVKHISQNDQSKTFCGKKVEQGSGHHGNDHRFEDHGPVKFDFFERRIAEVADHKQSYAKCEKKQDDTVRFKAVFAEKEYPHGEEDSRRWDGKSDKDIGVCFGRRNVEACKSDGAENNIKCRDENTETSKCIANEKVEQHGRSDPERDNVGQGIELYPELAGRVCQACDTPIQAIEDQCQQNEP